MMLGLVKTINGKPLIFYTSLPFEGYLKREGYCKIQIVNLDSSNLEKGYVTIYFNDMERGVIMQTNLMVKHQSASPSPSDVMLPLEKLIKLALSQKYGDEVDCMDIDFDILIDLECQFLVERINSYYNVTDVYPIDKELGEFVPKHIPQRRLPEGIFN